ncbi:MAG: response regulator transcription factor [Chloroflexota bacterium]|nr:response regulator transcription factor [Chloroflexota bacterium]
MDSDVQNLQEVALCIKHRWPHAQIALAYTGETGIELAGSESPDIVILESDLPDTDGLKVLQEIRLFSDVPIIVISSNSNESERIKGLELGADDYLTKPFSHREFLARTAAVLRRYNSKAPEALLSSFQSGALTIDFASQAVSMRGKPVRLTPIEYKLLCQLVKHAGETLSQKVLLEKVWGEDYLDAANYLKVHIHYLRQKLEEEPRNPQWIITVPRRGYKFVIQQE